MNSKFVAPSFVGGINSCLDGAYRVGETGGKRRRSENKLLAGRQRGRSSFTGCELVIRVKVFDALLLDVDIHVICEYPSEATVLITKSTCDRKEVEIVLPQWNRNG